jgi:hypothetical protein
VKIENAATTEWQTYNEGIAGRLQTRNAVAIAGMEQHCTF